MEYFPAGHELQSEYPELPSFAVNLPTGQLMQVDSELAEVSTEYFPYPQSEQDDMPGDSWYRPA